MKNSTPKLISNNRVIQLLASYGARSTSWPAEERLAALALIEKSPELKKLLHDAQALDEAMAVTEYDEPPLPKANSQLVSRIVNQLPEQEPIRSKVNIFQPKPWFNSERFGKLWQHSGLLATGMAMTLLIIVLLQPQPATQYDTYTLTQVELDQWLWEDVTGETQDFDEDVLDFMTLAEVEQMDEYEAGPF